MPMKYATIHFLRAMRVRRTLFPDKTLKRSLSSPEQIQFSMVRRTPLFEKLLQPQFINNALRSVFILGKVDVRVQFPGFGVHD